MKSFILGLVMIASVPAFASEKLKDLVVREGASAGIAGDLIVEVKNIDKTFIGLDNPAVRQGANGQGVLILSEGKSGEVICASLDATKAVPTAVYPASVSEMAMMGYSSDKVVVLSLENGALVAKSQAAKADDLVLTTLECADHALNDGD